MSFLFLLGKAVLPWHFWPLFLEGQKTLVGREEGPLSRVLGGDLAAAGRPGWAPGLTAHSPAKLAGLKVLLQAGFPPPWWTKRSLLRGEVSALSFYYIRLQIPKETVESRITRTPKAY